LHTPARSNADLISRSLAVGQRLGFLFLTLMLLLVLSRPLRAHEFQAGDLDIDHPWSREVPQGARVAAGYVVIRNHGAAADRLLSVSSAISGKSEIHEMAVNAEGVMTMRPVAGGVEIPADGEFALKPGGFHIMFMELTERPKGGEKFTGTLIFEKAGKVDVEFEVESR
jgi:copper(I)-binding protein